MKGDAQMWHYIIENEYESVEEFEKLMLSNYWGEDQQSKVRDNLFNGKYWENSNTPREKYILIKYSQVRHLEPRMTDSEIVRHFARHFNDNIRDVILIQGINTIQRLLQYLRRIDDIRPNNNTYRTSYNNETNRNGKDRNTGDKIENKEGDKKNYKRDGNKYYVNNYMGRKNYNDQDNRNFKNNQQRSNEKSTHQTEEKHTNEEENTRQNTSQTEWNRIEEITTAIIEPKSMTRSQNF